jgi:HEPN domain-containing protein
MDLWLAEWIDKAEADYRTMERESVVTEDPSHDVVCFCAQQCAEKYLKARLYVGTQVDPPRTHDLLLLLTALASHEPDWHDYAEDLALLSRFAARYRYPGLTADSEDAADAVRACRRFRAAARRALALDDPTQPAA